MKKVFSLLLIIMCAFFAYTTNAYAYAGESIDNPIYLMDGEIVTFEYTPATYKELYFRVDPGEYGMLGFAYTQPVGGSISTFTHALTGSSSIRILDEDGEPIVENYFLEGYGIQESNIYDVYTGVFPYTYYIEVTPNWGFDPNYMNPKVLFTCSFTPSYYTEVEPNNTRDSADLLEVGSEYDADIHHAATTDSEDWFVVQLQAGVVTRIAIGNLSKLKQYNVVIGLYDPYNNSTVISNTNKVDPQCRDYYYEFVPRYSGNYYIRVLNSTTQEQYYTMRVYTRGSQDRSLIEDVANDAASAEMGETVVYRLYNPNSGEHLYTTDSYEVLVITQQQGWGYEGVAWYASPTGQPVFRLYNPQLGNHLYTSDTYEISIITHQGWVLDFGGAPVMYSGGTIPIYRLYNQPLQGQHHLTTDQNEYNVLPRQGWAQEGIGMYAASKGKPRNTKYFIAQF